MEVAGNQLLMLLKIYYFIKFRLSFPLSQNCACECRTQLIFSKHK